ncbi:SDR family oxidoreductase [Streptomyces mirabilis]|uniref:SDR family oxidoreductase n=1 Tax=Streptomyces mirabilis TaxID=68239 RepID=UPI003677A9A1
MKAVVVGASSGLGRCIAVDLGRRGDRVALLARRRDRLVDAAKEAGPDALAVACDVTDESSCRAAVEEAAAGLGGIDALVYATGIGPLAPVEKLDADAWRRAMDTNVIGAALVTSAALPHLTKSGGEGDSRTGFNDGWDREYAAQVYPVWRQRGCLTGSLLDVEEFLRVLDVVLRCGGTIPEVTVTPRPPVRASQA